MCACGVCVWCVRVVCACGGGVRVVCACGACVCVRASGAYVRVVRACVCCARACVRVGLTHGHRRGNPRQVSPAATQIQTMSMRLISCGGLKTSGHCKSALANAPSSKLALTFSCLRRGNGARKIGRQPSAEGALAMQPTRSQQHTFGGRVLVTYASKNAGRRKRTASATLSAQTISQNR